VPVKYIFKDTKRQTWEMLHQTSSSLARCEEKHFAFLGLSPQQYAILTAVNLSPTYPTLTQIADWVDRHTNSITYIVDRMERDRLIKRVRNPEDRRAYSLVITAKGEKYTSTAPGPDLP
jgi:MarR family transcriptional regulator, 2-MHQ and catechol-resistance regulon repressor